MKMRPEFTRKEITMPSMEIGNKVVVEARFKGAGMHWARPNVDPVLGLRNILCSDRWEEDWKKIAYGLRQIQTLQQQAIHFKHRPVIQSPNPNKAITIPIEPQPAPPPTLQPPATLLEDPLPKSSIPASNHPSRHSPIGKTKFWTADHFAKN
jgi:hypothetical protein